MPVKLFERKRREPDTTGYGQPPADLLARLEAQPPGVYTGLLVKYPNGNMMWAMLDLEKLEFFLNHHIVIKKSGLVFLNAEEVDDEQTT